MAAEVKSEIVQLLENCGEEQLAGALTQFLARKASQAAAKAVAEWVLPDQDHGGELQALSKSEGGSGAEEDSVSRTMILQPSARRAGPGPVSGRSSEALARHMGQGLVRALQQRASECLQGAHTDPGLAVGGVGGMGMGHVGMVGFPSAESPLLRTLRPALRPPSAPASALHGIGRGMAEVVVAEDGGEARLSLCQAAAARILDRGSKSELRLLRAALTQHGVTVPSSFFVNAMPLLSSCDVLCHIFSYLDPWVIAGLMPLVSRAWFRVSQHTSTWARVTSMEFPFSHRRAPAATVRRLCALSQKLIALRELRLSPGTTDQLVLALCSPTCSHSPFSPPQSSSSSSSSSSPSSSSSSIAPSSSSPSSSSSSEPPRLHNGNGTVSAAASLLPFQTRPHAALTPSPSFPPFASLSSLNLSAATLLTAAAASQLPPLPQLTHLDLSSSPWVDDSVLVAFAAASQNLQTLLLPSTGISHTGLAALCRCCPVLRRLDISHSKRVGDAAVRALFAAVAKPATALVSKLPAWAQKAYAAAEARRAVFWPSVSPETGTQDSGESGGSAESGDGGGYASSLEELSLVECWQLTEVGISHIARMAGKAFRALDLSGCVKAVTLRSVSLLKSSLPRLAELTLDDTHFTVGLPGPTEGFRERCLLRKISLSGVEGMDDESLQALASACPALEALCVDGCFQLTDESFVFVAKVCPRLKSVSAVRVRHISDIGVCALAALGLTQLDLSFCSKVTAGSLQRLAFCPLLRDVRCRGCLKVGDAAFQILARMPQLLRVDLFGCVSLTSDGVQRALTVEGKGAEGEVSSSNSSSSSSSYAPPPPKRQKTGSAPVPPPRALLSLSLGGCPLIGDAAVRAVCLAMPRLKELNLYSCHLVSDEGLAAVAANCLALRKLVLAGCGRVTDKGIALVAACCARLRCLDLEDCQLLGDSALAAISIHCKDLKSLTLTRCQGISDLGIRHLVAPPPTEQRQARHPPQADSTPSQASLGAYFQVRPARLAAIDVSFCTHVSPAAHQMLAATGCRVLSSGSPSPL